MNDRKLQHFEDYRVGGVARAGEYLVTREEIIEFASKWDPQPFHIDEKAAEESDFGGLVACGCHTLAIAIWLMNRKEIRPCIVAGFGWDELRFPNPVRPGDRLSVTVECLEKRPSASRPQCGIVHTLCTVSNQRGSQVLRFKDTILVRCASGL